MKKQIFTFLFLIISLLSYSQNCDCAANFNWLKYYFETNDAGFKYSIDEKGLENYKTLNKKTILQAIEVKDKNECYDLLYNWLKFFRKGHFGIWANNVFELAQQDLEKKNKLDINILEFKTYLSTLKVADYEGIWSYENNLKIGVKRLDSKYVGFVIESPSSNLNVGQILFEIHKNGRNASAILYAKNKKKIVLHSVQLSSNKYLLLEFALLQRIAPENVSPRPNLEKINSDTYVLTIPSFEMTYKKDIDSLLSEKFQSITSTKNLIIDLRNNGGGSTSSYDKILPILYTNPIRKIALEYWGSKENARIYEEQALNSEKYGYSKEDKQNFITIKNALETNVGKFINVYGENVSILKLDSIYRFPKNIGIIINQNNGSAAEQFLIAAKQSQKVKTFGVSTMGEIDISNVWLVDSPCKDFKLAYSVSKSLRIPEMEVDKSGVQPDFYIDNSINPNDWIKFTNDLLDFK